MSDFKLHRKKNNVKDLLSLDAKCYCELGPGERGDLSIMLHEAGRKVIAVEAPWVDPSHLIWAREKGIKLYQKDLFNDDLTSITERVDCFFLAHCIAHFRFSPYELFKDIHELLPPGGYFYLSTVNATAYERVVDLMRGKPITERVSQHVWKTYADTAHVWNKTGIPQIWDDWMHVKEYTLEEIIEIFEKSGFTILRSGHVNNIPEWKRAFWKKNLAIKFFPHLADEIVVIGQKPIE